MARATFSAVIDHPVEVVWDVIGDFHGIDRWVGMITASVAEGGGRGSVGSVRRLTLADGRTVAERLLMFDDVARRLAYDFPEGCPFPVDGFVGSVELAPITETGATFLQWHSSFDADGASRDAMASAFQALYAGFVSDLRAHLEGSRFSTATPVATR